MLWKRCVRFFDVSSLILFGMTSKDNRDLGSVEFKKRVDDALKSKTSYPGVIMDILKVRIINIREFII